MASPTSIDPLRILPTSDTQALAHDLNRVLDRITQHLNNRYGFAESRGNAQWRGLSRQSGHECKHKS